MRFTIIVTGSFETDESTNSVKSALETYNRFKAAKLPKETVSLFERGKLRARVGPSR